MTQYPYNLFHKKYNLVDMAIISHLTEKKLASILHDVST